MRHNFFQSDSREDVIWVDMGKLDRHVGSQNVLYLRFLPVLDKRDHFVLGAKHKIMLKHVPALQAQNPKRQMLFVDCYDSVGGPGDCPICAIRKSLGEDGEALKRYRSVCGATKKIYALVLDLGNPARHYVPVLQPDGRPQYDANGQPVLKIQPGVISMNNTAYRKVAQLMDDPRAHNVDPTHVDRGYVVKLVRTKMGAGDLEVEYAAYIEDVLPLRGSAYESALYHLFPLYDQLIHFKPAEEMHALADVLRAVLVQSRGAGDWMQNNPAPGTEYNPRYQQTRPMQGAAAPSSVPYGQAAPPPPVAYGQVAPHAAAYTPQPAQHGQPPSYGQPPQAPPQQPPQAWQPPRTAPNLPPVGPPGAPAFPQQVAPGLPPGLGAVPQPNGPMTPDQLEQLVGRDSIPF